MRTSECCLEKEEQANSQGGLKARGAGGGCR
jgi:hypothetical protein